jgi:hydroxyacylglutathione hydrolase
LCGCGSRSERADQSSNYDKGLKLQQIWLTHHHFDHVEGTVDLTEEFGAEVYGFEEDQKRLPQLHKPLNDNSTFAFAGQVIRAMHVPGHTSGHLAFWLDKEKAVFTGDALFVAGCGRLFEGSPEQMWTSLEKLSQLPDETRVFCGHEYTLSNLRFALSVEPKNDELIAYSKKAESLRAKGRADNPKHYWA